MTKLAGVQRIYEAFGKGDVPTILEQLADDVLWEHDSVDHDVPWLKPGRGKAHVLEYFGGLGREFDVKSFAVLNLLEGGDQVAAVCAIEATIRSTQKPLKDYEVHLWTFDERERVIRFRHVVDTHQHWLAIRS